MILVKTNERCSLNVLFALNSDKDALFNIGVFIIAHRIDSTCAWVGNWTLIFMFAANLLTDLGQVLSFSLL